MEDKEKNLILTELIAKKRKLIDLREEIMLRSSHKKLKEQEGDSDERSPATPFSDDQPSISPPPYSPLTPLRTIQNLENNLQGDADLDIQQLYTSSSISPLQDSNSLPKNINIDDPILSSPVHSLSPEMQELYSEIAEPRLETENSSDIIENSDISEHEVESYYNDSDDSVKDPDFIFETIKKSIVDDSETECESYDEEEGIQSSTILSHKTTNSDVKSGTEIIIPSTITESKKELDKKNGYGNATIEEAEETESLKRRKDSNEKGTQNKNEMNYKKNETKNPIPETDNEENIYLESTLSNLSKKGEIAIQNSAPEECVEETESFKTKKDSHEKETQNKNEMNNKKIETKNLIPEIDTEDNIDHENILFNFNKKREISTQNSALEQCVEETESWKTKKCEHGKGTQNKNEMNNKENETKNQIPETDNEENMDQENSLSNLSEKGEIAIQNSVPEECVEDNIENESTVSTLDENSKISNKKHGKKGRSRKEKKECKTLRNTGKSYITEKGKVVPERRTRDLSTCRLKCVERITVAEQNQCFEDYWKLGQRDRRAAFVSKSVTILPKKSQRTDTTSKNRDYYCVYKLWISNEEKSVCKECFCRILDETKGFVNIVIEKKKHSPTGIIDIDQRGRQPPKNKRTTEEIILSAQNHIMSFPSYESHYCRKSTGKKYLPADFSIALMYREYKKTHSKPISLKLYAKCFHDLNLSFKQPSKDTCNTCDVLNTKIKMANGDLKNNLNTELSEHQNQAEKAYNEKRVDKAIAKNDSSIKAFAFDLQQCLPTPHLKTSVAFYKRQLWSFNLTIYDLATDEVTCYMWDETIGARGANQIASCLWHFCKSLPPQVLEVTFYSDTCGGQNKNNIVAMMFMYLLNSHPYLKTINHKFLISGHTHMECDSAHAIIEKKKKRTQMKINHLNDWIQLVRTCKVEKPPYKVVAMTLKDFLDFSDLKSKKGPFALKKQDESGEKFLWQPIKWLQYNKATIGKIHFKDSIDREAPFKSLNLRKRGKSTIETFQLNQISREPLPISKEKKKDLMDLLDLIDNAFHDFFKQIKTTGDEPTDPDLDEFNPDLED